jgi:predicted nuclease with RNAse H fold
MVTKAYIGIDLAIAKNKLLPICVCKIDRNRLLPLRLPRREGYPRGKGNRFAIDPNKVDMFVQEVIDYLKRIEMELKIRIVRIAIDAPSAFRRSDISRREAEKAMDKLKISCFSTPSECDFKTIIKKVIKHFEEEGEESNIPHANQLWMLAGFALFKKLRENNYECIEVFPQAIVKFLGCSQKHKSTQKGLEKQLMAACKSTGWDNNSDNFKTTLKSCVFGSMHDKLDAYLSAWIASLPKKCRTCHGNINKDDVIWTQNPS